MEARLASNWVGGCYAVASRSIRAGYRFDGIYTILTTSSSSKQQKQQKRGVVAEWLSRKTRNLVPSGASVRIWPTSIFLLVGLDGQLSLSRKLFAFCSTISCWPPSSILAYTHAPIRTANDSLPSHATASLSLPLPSGHRYLQCPKSTIHHHAPYRWRRRASAPSASLPETSVYRARAPVLLESLWARRIRIGQGRCNLQISRWQVSIRISFISRLGAYVIQGLQRKKLAAKQFNISTLSKEGSSIS